MNPKEIEEIFEDENIKQDLLFSVFLGLEILRKYVPNADITAATHDKVYCNVDVEQACNAEITKEDIINLRRMNWMIDEDCFAKFV
jgi:hypothetical protein